MTVPAKDSNSQLGVIVAIVLSLLVASAAIGAFIWYRKVHKQMEWRQVFFMSDKVIDDGSDVIVDMDPEDEGTPTATAQTRAKKLRQQQLRKNAI